MEAHLALVLFFEGSKLRTPGAVGTAAEEPRFHYIGERGRGDVAVQNLLGLRTNRVTGVSDSLYAACHVVPAHASAWHAASH